MQAPSPGLPHLKILATGGTIAGVQSRNSGYTAASPPVEALIAAVPGIQGLAQLELEQVAGIGSQDMDDALWLDLAQRAATGLARPEVDGLVITHGTDTMEETAYFLHLVLPSEKPIVLVGAMRPATAISADGPMNLLNAVATAAHPQARSRGVLVVANDEVHSARAIAKTNTTQVGTFRSINRGLAAVVQQGRLHWFSPAPIPAGSPAPFPIETLKSLPRVAIIYTHAGMERSLIDAARQAKFDGIVIAGVGSGNMHALALQAAREATTEGIAVVRASRTGGGMVERNMELDDDACGFVTACDLNPQKARVLLQLALTRTRSPEALQNLFDSL